MRCMIFSCHAVVAEWQTRCLQAAVIFGRAGSSPANRTKYKDLQFTVGLFFVILILKYI